MIDEVAARVSGSPRYRHVDPNLVARLAAEEAPRARNADDAVKRVKRRLHQAVGAFSGGRGGRLATESLAALRAAWTGDLRDPAAVEACRRLLASHASTAERVPHLDAFYAGIWEAAGATPGSVLDLGCGLAPLALPWMGLPSTSRYVAVDVDRMALETVDGFLDLVGQPHAVEAHDLAAGPPDVAADVALLLKLVPTLDRQDPTAAARLLAGLRARHAAVSFPRRSLGGRSKGMERTYRARVARLAGETGFEVVAEASVANELVFVLDLGGG